MSNYPEIKYLRNKQTDYRKWDKCLQKAGNKNLYGQSWYLDIVTPGWDALVYGDYEFVMPLPVKKRMGISAVLQPLHCQQLGIFPVPDFELQSSFCNKIFRLFPVVRYQMNAALLAETFGKLKFTDRINYLLPLEKQYKELEKNFNSNARRNIKKSGKAGVKVVKGLAVKEFFDSKNEAVNRKIPKKSHRILTRLMSKTITSGQGVIYAAYSETNTLCAAAFVIFEAGRIYYLNAFSTGEGMQNRAMYAIVNQIIREHSQSGWIIDFEGSMVEGVARFYKGFGAISEKYYATSSSRFPLLEKLI